MAIPKFGSTSTASLPEHHSNVSVPKVQKTRVEALLRSQAKVSSDRPATGQVRQVERKAAEPTNRDAVLAVGLPEITDCLLTAPMPHARGTRTYR